MQDHLKPFRSQRRAFRCGYRPVGWPWPQSLLSPDRLVVDAATRVNQKRANDELGALRRGQVVGPVDEVAERVLQFQRLSGEGAGGFDSAGVSVPRRPEAGGRSVSIVRTCLATAWSIERAM